MIVNKNTITGKWVLVDNHKIHYLESGEQNEETIVFIHGTFLDSNFLYQTTAELLSKNYRVIAVSLPGYGYSSKIYSQHNTFYFINFLDKFLKALDISDMSLVGNSMGGSIVLGYALTYQLGVQKLVLIDSYGLGHKLPMHKLVYEISKLPFLFDLIWNICSKSEKMFFLSMKFFVHNTEIVAKDTVAELRKLLRGKVGRKTIKLWLRGEIKKAGSYTNFEHQLHLLNIPTLIIHGERDRIIPLDWSVKASMKIKKSKLHVLKETGHNPLIDKPEEISQLIDEFLREK
ncbi:MAG: hypothetical protein UT18_C0001G0029 [candidate division CPR2 bacterium GW2011_GWC2_39_10]|uniref:Alpha/beta hydrolase fold protein n=1 Tax=candidate division CPR2 bacterium GW2011_GWC2_39_10 TaxID=1618345 RepID=A0A0G0LWM4_UNCC2|nr:MAG: hypothetical protein UT18_C0001G0029 [candidate division CPR2 bacterium GW2011_GWC2_39_10]